MGWFGNWTGSDGSTSDPYKKLDPTLRDFLDKETPARTEPDSSPPNASARSPDGASDTYRSQLGLESAGPDYKNQHSTPAHQYTEQPKVPKESLFQDGRYAHLWKNYRPQAEVEDGSKTDQDRLADIVAQYKNRKAEIARAAVDNCVEYQIAEKECFTKGSVQKRMSMCRDESKAFNRCYTMQTRFLSALGYLSIQRSAEEEERIQMHSDKLYHEMLERERLQNEAKGQGSEVPEMPSLIDPEKTTKALGENSSWARARKRAMEAGMSTNLSSYTPEKQEEIKKRIEGLSPQEKELELQLIAAESRSQWEFAEQINKNLEEEKRHREERRARGKETMGDALRRLCGY